MGREWGVSIRLEALLVELALEHSALLLSLLPLIINTRPAEETRHSADLSYFAEH
jgi:hypothetical protein